MMDTNTVLILGAGASEPYGFPIGSGLKKTILDGLSNDVELSLYRSSGFSNEAIAEFKDVLITSPFSTIDAILSYRPSLAKIGKFAIVKALSVCQKSAHVFPPRDWYHELFTRLGIEDLHAPQPPLSVLTFNYDNSLEYFFERIVDKMFEGEHQGYVRQRYKAIEIIHLHGRLGPYLNDGEDFITNPGHSLSQSDIKVISDKELDKAPEFVRAHKLLSDAKKVVFLGFGYASTNLHRLRIKDVGSSTAIYGTCYQTPEAFVRGSLGRDINLSKEHFTCLDALKNWKDVI